MMEFLTVYNYIIDEHRRRHYNSGSQINSNFWQPWKDLHDRREGKNYKETLIFSIRACCKLRNFFTMVMLADRNTSAHSVYLYRSNLFTQSGFYDICKLNSLFFAICIVCGPGVTRTIFIKSIFFGHWFHSL